MQKIEFHIDLSRKQTAALDALECPEIDSVLYGGAKGGGKSFFGCAWVFLQACLLIRQYALKPSANPLPVGFMGRKRGSDFNLTTLETWKRIIPAEAYRINQQDKSIILFDTVKVRYGGLDNSEEVRKFNSAEFAFFFLDQAEEVSEDDVGELRASLRLIIHRQKPEYKALYTANPRQCWLREAFILNPAPNVRFIQALPTDNPHLGREYIELLRASFKHRPELLRAYLEGCWDAFEGEDQIIYESHVREAAELVSCVSRPRKLVAVDVSRFGDDETVLYGLEETEIVREECFGKRPTTYTAQRAFAMSRAMGNCPIVVDADGVGGGVVDDLSELGAEVIEFHGAGTPREPDRFVNVRAEAWWTVGKMFADGHAPLHHEDAILRGQLVSPKYEFRGGKILVEDKDAIKKRLGRSPDRGDTYVMGVYLLDYGIQEPPESDQRRRQRRMRTSAMAM